MNRKFYRLNEAPSISTFSEYDIIHLIETGSISAYAKLDIKSAVLYAERKTIGTFNYNGVVKISKEDALKAFESGKTRIKYFEPIERKSFTSFHFGPIKELHYPNKLFVGYYETHEQYQNLPLKAAAKVSTSGKSFIIDNLAQNPALEPLRQLTAQLSDIIISEAELQSASLLFKECDIASILKESPQRQKNQLRQLIEKIVKSNPQVSIEEVWKTFKSDLRSDDQTSIFDKQGVIVDVVGNDHVLYTNNPSNEYSKVEKVGRKRVENIISEVRRLSKSNI